MKFTQEQKTVILAILCFGIYLIGKQYFVSIKTGLDGITQNGLISYTLTYLILGIPLFIGTYIIDSDRSVFTNLGLSSNTFKGLGIALIFALPMLLGGLLFFDFSNSISIPNLIAGTIVVGFIEELFYRGFFFGMLYKYTRLGFISSILLGALIFAAGHLYQSQDAVELIGVFAVTFMGAILFAWLYVEWNYNLWIPIFLHAFMNLAWSIFEMDSTALGGIMPNVLRGLTIAFAIIGTILIKKKQKQKIEITKSNLFIKPV